MSITLDVLFPICIRIPFSNGTLSIQQTSLINYSEHYMHTQVSKTGRKNSPKINDQLNQKGRSEFLFSSGTAGMITKFKRPK